MTHLPHHFSDHHASRTFPLISASLATILACFASTSAGFADLAGNAANSAAPNRSAAADLPDHVDNSLLPSFPPVTSQGPTGACSIFAALYYQMTHMAGLANGYNNKTSKANVFAPNWSMNFGTGGIGCYDLARKNGCASWEDIPFTPEPHAWNTDPAVWARALKHRVDENGSIGNIDTPEGFHKMKRLLSEGHVLYFDTWIGSFQFMLAGDDPSTDKDAAFVGKNVVYGMDDYVAGHSFAVVGYNDHVWVDINGNGKVDPGEKGVIKIVNSWGEAYEDRGFTYVAYDALRENSIVEGVPENRRFGSIFNHNTAYWVTFKTDYYPRLFAWVTLNTSRRDQLKVQLGYSTNRETSPKYTWDSNLMNHQGGARGFDGTEEATDGGFVFDFTDLITEHNLEGKDNGRWYVIITDSEADGNPVILKNFTLIDNITKKRAASPQDFPISIDGETSHAWVDFALRLPNDTQPPTRPANLAIEASYANSATLTWEPSSDNVAIKHYQVFRDREPLLTTERTSITETNLPLGQSYVYHVAAVDTSNNMSLVSNPVTVKADVSAIFDTTATYKFTNKKSGKTLAVAQGTYQPGVPFVQYNYSGQGNQHLKMEDAGDGSYRIVTMPGDLLLQVNDASLYSGARVTQWSDNGSDGCKWIMIPYARNTYAIANKSSGMVLSVVDASKDDGATMEQTTFTKDDSQLWVIETVRK